MFRTGDVVDGRYKVLGQCSDAGGMGSLVFVRRKDLPNGTRRVLKYCKLTEPEAVKRFKREVRLMMEFEGNARVMQIRYSNLDHDPPYFVMDHYSDGDLTALVGQLQDDLPKQEQIFTKMIECVEELHSAKVFHRDIKPPNFLRDGEDVVVSDFGLSTEFDSSTAFTRSSQWWGTPGYLPPEFSISGGFRNATAASDVFMLGRTMYHLLTGRDPTYLLADDIPKPLFVVIERCCALNPAQRYQDLASLKQSLGAVYDVLLGRVIGSGLAVRALRSITDELQATGRFKSGVVRQFVEQLAMLEDAEKADLCKEIPKELFPVLADASLKELHESFLGSYRVMVEEQDYGWGYAERIADSMEVFFDGAGVTNKNKAAALINAILAAHHMNRFAAMDTCRSMVRGVDDDELAQYVHDVIKQLDHTFIADIEPSTCRAAAIKRVLGQTKAGAEPDDSDF